MVSEKRRNMVVTTENIGNVERFPRRAPQEAGHNGKVVTTRVYEEDLQSLDAEVLHALAAPGWVATFRDGSSLPLVCWAVLDDDRGYGVVLEEGRLNVSVSVEDRPGFAGYVYMGGC